MTIDFKNKTETEEQEIYQGRIIEISTSLQEIKPSTTITTDILSDLNSSSNKFDAIDMLVDQTPFGKMALNVYTTLTNPQGKYTFVDPTTGERTKDPDNDWELFTRQRFMNSDEGIEAVYETLVRSLYTRGDMAFEIVVKDDLSGIDAIIVIDPQTFTTFKWIDDENRYAIYQTREDNQEVDLYEGNFYRFINQPIPNYPIGTIPFEPAIVATINYYQHLLDATTVLNRIGYPRYIAKVDEEAVFASANHNEKQTFEQRQELLQQVFENIELNLKKIGRDSDLLTSTSTDINILGAGVTGSGLDIRAWFETDVVELCNAYALPRIYLNAEKSGSYALGSAEQETLIKRISASRDKMISAKEAIGTMLCRVMGYNAICQFIPNPIEWENLTEKWEAKLKELEYYRRSEEYGYLSKDAVSVIVTQNETADNQNSDGYYEYLAYNYTAEESTTE